MQHKRKRIRLGSVLVIVGAAAIIAAAAMWLYNDYEDNRAASYSLERAEEIFEYIMAEDPEVTVDESPAGFKYMYLGGEEYLGIISIPRLTLNLPVNVNWSYPALKKSPCRFSGSIEENDIVIAAHNYRTHFARIYTLKYGDQIAFTDVEGGRIYYSVADIETVDPTATRSVVSSDYDLTLFTCTYNGQARVVVRCLRDSD